MSARPLLLLCDDVRRTGDGGGGAGAAMIADRGRGHDKVSSEMHCDGLGVAVYCAAVVRPGLLLSYIFRRARMGSPRPSSVP